jgi:hypothetical protein
MITQECVLLFLSVRKKNFLLEIIRGMLKGGDDMGLSEALVNFLHGCM